MDFSTTYQKALEWLFVQMPNYQKDGQKAYKPGLDNIKKLCTFFGNPQESLRMIHIAGTNGKGSTSHMLTSVLQEAGYRVGIYNSPHLIEFTERIKINGHNADKLFVLDFIQQLKNLPKDIRPSFFEFTTVMAFEYFKTQRVDFAIIETGLGGRLDATNIITPILSAITNIALDHQDLLGQTLAEIATEKGGIIKPHTPIISGEESEDIKNIFKTIARQVNAPFIDATQETNILTSDLKGDYQTKNIKIVQALVKTLRAMGISLSEDHLTKGLLKVYPNTHFLGRWFEFSQTPLTICDTGHNEAGLSQVFTQLRKINKYKHIILGFVKDKNIEAIIPILPKEKAQYYFVKPKINRGLAPKNYELSLKKAGINYKIFDEVNLGYISAKAHCKRDEMIFIGGSNFVVGEFLEKNLPVCK